MPESWEKDYPRLHDLYVNSERGHSENYFARFQNHMNFEHGREVYSELEKRLSLLSVSAWSSLRCKALKYVKKKHAKRAWTQLFDILNEAYGYELLLNAGYDKENITFICGLPRN